MSQTVYNGITRLAFNGSRKNLSKMSTRKSIKIITCALISLKKNFSAHPENQVVIDFVLATGKSSTKTDRASGTFEKQKFIWQVFLDFFLSPRDFLPISR